jgi:HB1, ASXL, restriction endonuclease HTH domain
MDDRTTELATWRAEAERELEKAQSSMDDAQRRLDAARERLSLLDRLLLLEGRGLPADEASTPDGRPQDFLDACEAVLREAGEPLHVSELLTRLKAASVSLPGRGTDANIIVRLRRAEDRFVRTGRGMYGLTEFGVPEVPTSTKRRRKRRRS